jgi:hypothetical protein
MTPHKTEQSVHDVPEDDSTFRTEAALSSHKVSEAPITPSVTFQANTTGGGDR